MSEDGEWRYRRAVARIEGAVDEVLAEFAASYVGRAVQRREPRHPGQCRHISVVSEGE
jgi:hypothetical protein